MAWASSTVQKTKWRFHWTGIRRTAVQHSMLSYGRSLIACTLLLSFLNTIFLPSPYRKIALPTSTQASVLCPEDDSETLLNYLVDCCLEVPENLPDEEGDPNNLFKLTKDFVGLGYQNPLFSRAFLGEFNFPEIQLRLLGLTLQHFSPPPEK